MKNLFNNRMQSLQSKFTESLNLDHSDFNGKYDEFVYNFALKENLPALHIWEDGYKQGDASINDLVDLKNTLNEKYGDEDPAVNFELNENDNWEKDGEEEFFTDIFEFLDQKFINEFETFITELIEKNGRQ